ncbi:MAG: hypothetical protein M5U27_10920 [Gaiella sp.]|nr:hypothetical protein [Gaiella sp.]
MEASSRELPFTVWLAAIFGFAKAGFLALMGVIGVFAWDSVTDPWGFGALVLAALFGVASYLLLRGNRVARLVIAGLAVAGGALALVYVFVGPTSAILPSLTTAALAVLLLWLLFGPRSAQEYFAT